MSILQKIIAQKEIEVSGLKSTLKNAHPQKNTRSFLEALSNPPNKGVCLIAEIKKASPSRGEIAPEIDVMEVAEIYEASGVAAISVLTDYEFFQGSLADLSTIAHNVSIPVLRKDFIIDLQQILEARLSGASAVLLMTCILKTAEKLKTFREYAENLGMDALIETENEAELETALKSDPKIIGVNARSFTDLSVDLSRVPPPP